MAKNHLKLMCLGSLTVGRPLGGSFHSPTHQSATFPSEATWPPPPTGLGSHHAPPDRLIIGCWPRDLSGFFGVCCVLHVGAGSWPYLMRDEAFFMQILYVVSQKKKLCKTESQPNHADLATSSLVTNFGAVVGIGWALSGFDGTPTSRRPNTCCRALS